MIILNFVWQSEIYVISEWFDTQREARANVLQVTRDTRLQKYVPPEVRSTKGC